MFELYFRVPERAENADPGADGDGQGGDAPPAPRTGDGEVDALLDMAEQQAAGDPGAMAAALQRAGQQAGVDDIRFQSQTAYLTRQLLAYAGKGRFVVEAVDASTVVHEMSALLRTAISRSAAIQLDLASELPAIEVDSTQFRQVVMNLITNASDSLAEQGGLITLRTGVREIDADVLARCIPGTNAVPGRFVFIEVNDTGVGMDAATVARVFDPFFSTKFTGRGLGLAATLGIMRSHSGAIRVYSEVSKGTSFCLYFPASTRTPAPVPAPPSAQWTSTGQVLVEIGRAHV